MVKGEVVDIASRRQGQLPSVVADKLRALQQQIEQLNVAQRQYLQGALDALGVVGQVNIAFDTMTYQVTEEEQE